MIQLDLQSRTPIYQQMVDRIAELVTIGVYEPDQQLPSVRSVARDLGVNPNTVQKAYQELERQGVLYSISGRGSFVKPGGGAQERIRLQSLDALKSAVECTKRAGVQLREVIEVAHEIYGEGQL